MNLKYAIYECEKLFDNIGYGDFVRNYEIKGMYGGYVFAGIKNMEDVNNLMDKLCFFKLLERSCKNSIEIEYDKVIKRLYIRIITI